MAKFLSETGLQTVWSKIDSLFVRKASIVSAPSANSTSPISAGGVYSALEEIEDTIAASENALNTRVTALENNTVSGSGLTADKLVFGNGGRTIKTSTYGVTTTAPSSSSNDTTIPTSKAVWDAFGSVASALKYKGTIASSGGTITALPASHAVGDVYVVKTAGTYAGKACEVGDYIICNTAGTSANDAHWDVLNGENQVENKSASLAAAGSSATIATVDGTDITVTTPSGWTGLTKTGTVTSVGMTVPTGLSVSGSPVTGSGTLAVSFTSGYSIPTTAKQGNWDTAYGWGNHASAGYLTAHQTIKQDGLSGATANRYGTCSTAAATAAKTVNVTSGTVNLEAGLRVTVKFTSANTANSPTLNVNSKGAKNIFHNGAQITSGGNKSLLAGTVDFVYDGTQWHLVGNDTQVAQSASTTDSYRGILTSFSTTAAGTAATGMGQAYTVANLYCQPSSGKLFAGAFAKVGGTSSQFLKADGSVDSNTYSTTSHNHDSVYVKLNPGAAEQTIESSISSAVNGVVEFYRSSGDHICFIGFSNKRGTTKTSLGAIGFRNSSYTGPYYKNGSNYYALLHEGNYSSYVNTTNFPGINKTGTVTSVTLTSGTGITVSDSGTAITGSGSRTISLASGVATAGTYRSVTVDTYGRVTSGTNPTTLSGYGITDALPLSGGTMTGNITLNGVSILPSTDAVSGATSGLGYLGSSNKRFRTGHIRDLYTSYFTFVDGETGATTGSINFMPGASFLRPVDENDSSKSFDYKFYVNSTSNGFFYEEGTGVCVPLGKSDHRWSKVWATDADFSGTTTVGGSIYPSTDITSHLGSGSYRFSSASIVNHYNTRNIVFVDQTTGYNCVQLWGGDGYLRVATGSNINSSKKEIIFHENYGLYPELGTTTNLGYYSSTDNRFRWANVYAVNGNFSGTIIANGQTVLDESMALTTSEIDTILANAT